MVDFGQITKDRNIDTLLLDKLRPGDIYTHCFSGHREEVLENGKLNPAMVEGRKRKIIFDIGFGQASFYWYVAVPAYQAGFHPDSISTDLHTNSMNGGMKDMNNVMTAILSARFAVRRCDPHVHLGAGAGDPATRNWATWMWAPRRTSRCCAWRRATSDCSIPRRRAPAGTQRICCEMTLRKGQVVWDLNGLAGEDWQKFSYRKGPFFKK